MVHSLVLFLPSGLPTPPARLSFQWSRPLSAASIRAARVSRRPWSCIATRPNQSFIKVSKTFSPMPAVPEYLSTATASRSTSCRPRSGRIGPIPFSTTPLASGRPLSGIPGFRELPKKEEILQAVKLHHKRPQGLLGKTLNIADQLARQKELEKTALHHNSELVPVLPPVPEKKKSAPIEASAAWQAETDIYGEIPDSVRNRVKPDDPQLMDIAGWFDDGGFISELKPYITKMFGGRFLAFSIPEGHVYFQAKVLEEWPGSRRKEPAAWRSPPRGSGMKQCGVSSSPLFTI